MRGEEETGNVRLLVKLSGGQANWGDREDNMGKFAGCGENDVVNVMWWGMRQRGEMKNGDEELKAANLKCFHD